MNAYPNGLYVDEEGDWYYQGNRIVRNDLIQLFLANLQRSSSGEYAIELNHNRCSVSAADTPFVVSTVDRTKAENSSEEQIVLSLRHFERSENLDPSSLWVGENDVLYCQISKGRFPARFSRPAYYQLTEWLQEDSTNDEYFIYLNGKAYFIRRLRK